MARRRHDTTEVQTVGTARRVSRSDRLVGHRTGTCDADELACGEVVALLAEADQRGWDHRAGVILLRRAEDVARPVVRNVARRHRVAEEGLRTASLLAAWQALRRYDPARSPDPWGWVARAVQRAAVDAALMARTGQPARNRARLAAAIAAAMHRLTDELGRPPAPDELLAGITSSARAMIQQSDVALDPRGFVEASAPLLTYDDAVLDRPADVCANSPRDSGPRLRMAAEVVAAETQLPHEHAAAIVELAADLIADLLPSMTTCAACARAAAELAHAPEPVGLSARQARLVVDTLLEVVRAGRSDESAA
jgi:hypothetical protein